MPKFQIAVGVQELAQKAIAAGTNWRPSIDLPKPLSADNWVSKSVLQKAIRRGDKELAVAAAQTLLVRASGGLWRRLAIIALEDVGVANLELVMECVATHLYLRRMPEHPKHQPLALSFTERLAASVKDRSTDDIYEAVLCTNAGAGFPDLIGLLASSSAGTLLTLAAESETNLRTRAIVALELERRRNEGAPVYARDRGAPWGLYLEAGVPELLVDICEPAAREVQDALAILLPLVWIVANGAQRACTSDALPPAPILRGVPAYCLDQFTSAGKSAIGRFADSCPKVRAVLADCTTTDQWKAAACAAVFRVEGSLCDRRLAWSGGVDIFRTAAVAALACCQIQPDRVDAVFAAVRDNLPALHEIRAQTYGALTARRSPGAA